MSWEVNRYNKSYWEYSRDMFWVELNRKTFEAKDINGGTFGIYMKNKGAKWKGIYLLEAGNNSVNNILKKFLRKKGISKFRTVDACLGTYFGFGSINLNEENIKFVKEFYPKKLKEFKNRIIRNKQEDEENRRSERLFYNVKNVNYKTKEGYLKAVKELAIDNPYEKIWVSIDTMGCLLDIGFSFKEIHEDLFEGVHDFTIEDFVYLRKKGVDFKEFKKIDGIDRDIDFNYWIQGRIAGFEKEAKSLWKRKPKPNIYCDFEKLAQYMNLEEVSYVKNKEGKWDLEEGELSAINNRLSCLKLGDLV